MHWRIINLPQYETLTLNNCLSVRKDSDGVIVVEYVDPPERTTEEIEEEYIEWLQSTIST